MFNSNLKTPSVVNCPINTLFVAVGPVTPVCDAIAPFVDIKDPPAGAL